MTTLEQIRQQYDNIPPELRILTRWCFHKLKPRKNGKLQKVPMHPDGRGVSCKNPDEWNAFSAVQTIPAGLDGISLVLAGDGIVCIDLDGVRDPETGAATPDAEAIIAECNSYTEISQSGTGFHIFLKGSIPKASHKNGSWVEIYARDKIIAMTGDVHDFYFALEERDITSLFERAEAGEFAPACTDKARVQTTGKTESDEDWRLIGELHRQTGTSDAAALETAFAAKYPARYAERNREKGPHAGKNYFAYTIGRFLTRLPATASEIKPLPPPIVVDMPPSVLDGRLGEICQRRLSMFPLAYSWGALVTCAGTLVPRSQKGLRTNLYWCPVGDQASGKSQAIEQSLYVCGMWPKHDLLVKGKFGSVEGMLAHLDSVQGQNRLIFPDELGHLLEKANIEGSSFPFLLNSAYYDDEILVTMARGKKVDFNCRVSLAGGVVHEMFGDLFGAKTTGGLHGRFCFGLGPKPFTFLYRPYDSIPPESVNPVAVEADPEIWDVRDEWVKTNCDLTPRIAEHALRVATICAAFDGRKLLRAKDLGPALEFAKYQVRVRTVLQPNPGENPDARCAFSIIGWLRGNAANGQPVPRRAVYSGIHAARLGPGVFDRALKHLVFNEEIRLGKIGKAAAVSLTAANIPAAHGSTSA